MKTSIASWLVLACSLTLFASSIDGPVVVFVELASPPLVEAVLEARATRQADPERQLDRKAAIDLEQRRLIEALKAKGFDHRHLYSMHNAVNGVVLEVSSSSVPRLEAESGVIAVEVLEKKFPLLDSTLDFVGATTAWASHGLTGQGVRIAIIDTGIDPIHRTFGGSGLAADSAANDPSTNSDGFFPVDRVVDGWDFVGDDYDGSNAAAPDEDPTDCNINRHGTGVAAIAAGSGVAADGSQYTGTYDATTPLAEMPLAPGVAPRAELVIYKVFGCSGGTDFAEAAIDRALDPNQDGDLSDAVDVINLSLGSDYGSPEDFSARTVDAAAALGVVVAAAAGNSRDSYYIHVSPAVSSGAIAVGGTNDGGQRVDQLEITAPAAVAGLYEASVGLVGPQPIPDLSGLVVAADPADACSDLLNAAALNGNIAWIRWGPFGCNYPIQLARLQAAGAIAAIFRMDFDVSPPFAPAGLATAVDLTIPSMQVNATNGALIEAELGNGLTATLSTSHRTSLSTREDMVYGGSSSGPRRFDGRLKPDLTAPAFNIITAAGESGNAGILRTGTSYAAPHVAGAAAILLEASPSSSPLEVKALLMNNAVAEQWALPSASGRLSPTRVGAGRLDLGAAIAALDVGWARWIGEPMGVSVGLATIDVDAGGQRTISTELELTSRTRSSETWTLSYEPVVDAAGVSLSLPISPLIDQPGATTSIPFDIVLDGSLLEHGRDPNLATLQGEQPRDWLAEESGILHLEASGGTILNIPLQLVARPRSTTTIGIERLTLAGSSGSESLSLSGSGFDHGTGEQRLRSLAQVHGLRWISPPTTGLDIELQPADLAAVGYSSDYSQRLLNGEGLAETVLSFVTVTHQAWAHQPAGDIAVWIDRDRDGSEDIVLFNSSRLQGARQSDALWSQWCELPSFSTCGFSLPQDGQTPDLGSLAPYETRLRVLSATAGDLGLSSGTGAFWWRLESWRGPTLLRSTPIFADDPENPGLAIGGLAPEILEDQAGTPIDLDWDRSAMLDASDRGLMVLHHHGTEQLEIVRLLLGSACDADASGVTDGLDLGAAVDELFDQPAVGDADCDASGIVDAADLAAIIPLVS